MRFGIDLEFPDDENGDVLRRMLANGDDLSRARTINFEHVFSSKSDALSFLTETCGEDITVSMSQIAQDGRWNVQVSTHMLPTHSGITDVETRFDSVARTFGGIAMDGVALTSRRWPTCNLRAPKLTVVAVRGGSMTFDPIGPERQVPVALRSNC